jgi:hypothetical protein
MQRIIDDDQNGDMQVEPDDVGLEIVASDADRPDEESETKDDYQEEVEDVDIADEDADSACRNRGRAEITTLFSRQMTWSI